MDDVYALTEEEQYVPYDPPVAYATSLEGPFWDDLNNSGQFSQQSYSTYPMVCHAKLPHATPGVFFFILLMPRVRLSMEALEAPL